MFKTIRDAFKIKEIRNGLIFTFLMLIVVRLGSLVPTPGVDVSKLENFFSNNYKPYYCESKRSPEYLYMQS